MNNTITPQAKKAIIIVDAGKVSRMENGNYRVASQTDEAKWYQVSIHNCNEAACDCADFTRHASMAYECKHVIAARLWSARQHIESADLWGKPYQAMVKAEKRQWWIQRYGVKVEVTA